jgi:hypothetical protein
MAYIDKVIVQLLTLQAYPAQLCKTALHLRIAKVVDGDDASCDALLDGNFDKAFSVQQLNALFAWVLHVHLWYKFAASMNSQISKDQTSSFVS